MDIRCAARLKRAEIPWPLEMVTAEDEKMNGILVIDKPPGLTSHDVVNRVRRLLGERAVGHLGTLDPMATGVLPLVIGRMTRLAQFYTNAEKTYEGEIRFGFATDTYDADGEPSGQVSEVQPLLEDVRAQAAQFQGEIEQVPPPFSAKKIKGVPAYRLARGKRPVALAPVKVEIKEFQILGLQGDRASFRARVASGTYLRSVAHEMGIRLALGAHLASLRRSALAEFDLSQSHTLEEVQSAVGTRELEPIFVPPRRVLPQFPAVSATDELSTLVLHGRAVNLPDLSRARLVKVFRGQGELIAIAARVAGTMFHPKVVLGAGS